MISPTTLFDDFRTWIMTIVPSAVPVVRAYNDAPAPVEKGTFIAIEDDLTWSPQGQRSVGSSDGTNRIVVTDYLVKFPIWECRGDGELLRIIAEALDTFAVLQLFSAKGISVSKLGDITKVPSLQDKSFWLVNHRLELSLGVARYATDAVPTVASVGVTGTVTAGESDIDVEITVDAPP